MAAEDSVRHHKVSPDEQATTCYTCYLTQSQRVLRLVTRLISAPIGSTLSEESFNTTTQSNDQIKFISLLGAGKSHFMDTAIVDDTATCPNIAGGIRLGIKKRFTDHGCSPLL